MTNFIRLTDFTRDEIQRIFQIADDIGVGKYKDYLKNKTVVLFFPETSIRTRVSFEKGIHLLGGQSILFPTETLDKREAIQDVFGYLDNWADIVVARHRNIDLLEEIAKCSKVPVINAMTNCNHPCEVLSDLYTLSKIRDDFTKDKYLFCGENGNIGLAWKEAAEALQLELAQCCPKGFEMEDVNSYEKIQEAILGKDIVCTDSLPKDLLGRFADCQVSKKVMEMANDGAVLNPCPPFYRGEEVTADAIDSKYFVGYEFKKNLLVVQQAIMIFCMGA